MKLLSAVLLSALSLSAVPALAVEASPSPLLGRWSLDIATSALPEAQRPKQVVLEFKDAGAGRWSAHVDIVLHDGKTMKSDGTLALSSSRPDYAARQWLRYEGDLRSPREAARPA